MPTDESSLLGYLSRVLPECKSSKTSCEEGRGKVSIRPENGEDVCFFNFNKQNNEHACRVLLIDRNSPRENERVICDCLIFFGRKLAASNTYEETLCVVELKGSDLKHAMLQLLNTHKHLWKLLADNFSSQKLEYTRKKAYIYQHGSVPHETKDRRLVALRRELHTTFDSFKPMRNSDIGPFLRE